MSFFPQLCPFSLITSCVFKLRVFLSSLSRPPSCCLCPHSVLLFVSEFLHLGSHYVPFVLFLEFKRSTLHPLHTERVLEEIWTLVLDQVKSILHASVITLDSTPQLQYFKEEAWSSAAMHPSLITAVAALDLKLDTPAAVPHSNLVPVAQGPYQLLTSLPTSFSQHQAPACSEGDQSQDFPVPVPRMKAARCAAFCSCVC